MIHTGSGKLCLFNILSDTDHEIAVKLGEDLIKELHLVRGTDKFQLENSIPLIPAADDFYYFPFRHLSATTVGGGTFKATDFSKRGVLSNAAKLLTGKPAYKNHYLLADEDIGHIGEARYRRGYTNSNGEDVPAGIEAPFVIDSILHPKLVRKLSSPVSPISSASVTVFFEWEASHDFEEPRDFFWHLGEIVDDEMVRRIVHLVQDFGESSLVWDGADPFAKMLNDSGEVILIDKKAAFSNELPEYDSDTLAKKYFVFDCLDKSKLLHLSKSATQFSSHEHVETMHEELLQYLASQFGTTIDALKKGTFKKGDAEKFAIKPAADFQTISDKAGTVDQLNADKLKLEGEKASLTTKVGTFETEKTTSDEKLDAVFAGELEKVAAKTVGEFAKTGQVIMAEESFKDAKPADIVNFAKQGKTILEATKAQAVICYGVFSDGKPDSTISAEITNESNLETLNSKIKMWGGDIVSKFGATCTTCGEDANIEFRSSLVDDDGTGKPGGNSKVKKPTMAEGLRS